MCASVSHSHTKLISYLVPWEMFECCCVDLASAQYRGSKGGYACVASLFIPGGSIAILSSGELKP